MERVAEAIAREERGWVHTGRGWRRRDSLGQTTSGVLIAEEEKKRENQEKALWGLLWMGLALVIGI